ncbi:hypothetical protein [Microvirga tunisiensis]|uniref:Uncharacterized protein n=1 Tax=Microvirga tunisiensis TaxID=2108360 RepID=A0A5N7MGE9_9HYPH|nr:hypothetical protein [Microvirga tunisiensis]MPR06192.1 hypothetical protein [Microvirga tunisiensis]MPR26065.1 hypothetical protein [Microvirga tunisiensis]
MTTQGLTDWQDSIAASAGAPRATVEGTLAKYGIQAQATLPRRRALAIRSVRFEGVKHGNEPTDRFAFEWDGLGPGLWALLTDGNSKGKSSVLAVTRAVLQGRFPGGIKQDVWAWIDRVDATFAIDGVEFAVRLIKPAGTTRARDAHAAVIRGQGAVLYEGPADEGLERTLSDIFLEELGFAKFQAYRSDTGRASEHGWPAMSSALFISGPGVAIFGDYTEDGLPIRLIQLFVGLPWISTYTAASTALKRLEAEQRKDEDADRRQADHATQRIIALENELQAHREALKRLPDRRGMRAELKALDARLAAAQAEVTDARHDAELRKAAAAEARSVHAETRRQLQQERDEQAAGYVFRRLRPVCCPACEARFEVGRFEAAPAEICGLCGTADLPEEAPRDGEAFLAAAVSDAKDSLDAATAAAFRASESLRDAESARDGVLRELEDVQSRLAYDDGAEQIHRDIAGVEARIDELRKSIRPEIHTSRDQEEVDILEATVKATKHMFERLQQEVLADVSRSLTRLSTDFGVRNLESMNLLANGQLRIRQGGTDLSFTKLTPGEMVRVRVAAALATLEVAGERGYGRHPGLLVLDSPGAQEMSADDFSALIGSVASAVGRFGNLQVIVGAVSRPELEERVPLDRRRQVRDDKELF